MAAELFQVGEFLAEELAARGWPSRIICLFYGAANGVCAWDSFG